MDSLKKEKNIFYCHQAIYHDILVMGVFLLAIFWFLVVAPAITLRLAGYLLIIALIIQPFFYFRYRWYEVSDKEITIHYLFGWKRQSIIELASIKNIEMRYSGEILFRWAQITLSDGRSLSLPIDRRSDFTDLRAIISHQMQKLGLTLPESKNLIV
jgi:hypothetical protein